MRKTPNWQRIGIVDIYRQLLKERGTRPSGREVHERFVAQQSKRLIPVPLPSLRKVQDILANAVPELEKARDVDQPWSLGASEKHGIPPEASKDLLEIWKTRLATGRFFSIREAKWAARLRNIVQDKYFLGHWAELYALREQTCDFLLIAPETSDLDASLVMTAWEQETAKAIGMLEPIKLTSPYETWIVVTKPFLKPLQFGLSRLVVGTAEEVALVEKGAMVKKKGLALQPLEDLKLSEEAEWVYVFWLEYLSEGPKWRNLSPEKHREILLQLRDWVKNHPWAQREFNWEIWSEFNWETEESTEFTRLLKPTQLLKMVGYEVAEDIDQEGQGGTT